MLEIELARPLSALNVGGDGGARFDRARFVARVHGWPLGYVDVALGPRGLSALKIAEAVREQAS